MNPARPTEAKEFRTEGFLQERFAARQRHAAALAIVGRKAGHAGIERLSGGFLAPAEHNVDVVTVGAAQVAAVQKHDRAQSGSVHGRAAQELADIGLLGHPYILSWQVRAITSSCCARVSLWKLTA